MAVLKHLTYLRISNIPTAFVEGTNDQNSEFCVATCLVFPGIRFKVQSRPAQ